MSGLYKVEIVSESVEEIRKVEKVLGLPLGHGVIFRTKELADSVACAAYDICPWIDVNISKLR